MTEPVSVYESEGYYVANAMAPDFVDFPPFTLLSSRQHFVEYNEKHARDIEENRALERTLAQRDEEKFTIDGFCSVCEQSVELAVDYLHAYPIDGVLTPNWRERLICPLCHFNNRTRATIHLMQTVLAVPRASSIYMTEQLTPLFHWMSHHYSNVEGSEYLGEDVPLGEVGERGARNEDVTRLTFSDRSFDLVICLDVLEHLPDYTAALAELRRVMAPNGALLLSVPFRADLEETVVRARFAQDGSIEHLLPPEYHGDPIRTEGCLAFYHYGWDLLSSLKQAGFVDVRAAVYWSAQYGYLGREQILLLARRPSGIMRSLLQLTQRTARRIINPARYLPSP